MSRELYVGKLSPETTADDLRRLFSVAGTVRYIRLITDPETGEFKRCGYVTMSSAEEAREAIVCLDGARIDNHEIVVSIARPQPQKAPGTRNRGKRPGPPRRPAPERGPKRPRP